MTGASELSIREVIDLANGLRSNVERVIEGKPDVVATAVTVLLAGGHLLVEDVPGVGKTVLAKTLARSIDASLRRIQFTPDLLPSDITGVSIFDQLSHQFTFRPGAVFANIVIGDEINRASPKTQSALLEAMEERQVTIDGETRKLPHPFMVVATQNPIEMDGTYALPEAQRDRFMAKVSMGYPSSEAETLMLAHHGIKDPLETLSPIADAEAIAGAIRTVAQLHTSESLLRYVVDMVAATRSHAGIHVGASPRASLQLLHASRAHAVLEEREYVIPEDVQAMAVPVLAHRLVMGRRDANNPVQFISDIITQVSVPRMTHQ